MLTLIIVSTLSVAFNILSVAAIPGFKDDFSTSTLDPEWQVWRYDIRAPSPPGATYQRETSYSLTDRPGYLRYYLGTRTKWYVNAPHWDGTWYWYYPSMHLYRTFDGTNWILETKITYSAPSANAAEHWTYLFFGDPQQGQGWKNNSILIYGNVWNVAHYVYLKDNGTQKMQISLPITRYLDTFYYRIIRSGYQFTFQWSRDGITYNTAFTESMGSQIDGLPQGVGITGNAFWSDSRSYSEYDYIYVTPSLIATTVDIDPDTLNLRSEGKWTTAYIQLPEGHDVENINATTISLNGTISPVLDPKYDFVTNSSEYLVDHNNDGILERMIKFNRTEVSSWIYDDLGIQYGNVTLTITGEVNGIPFEGIDIVKVLFPGDVDDDGDCDRYDYGLLAEAYGTSVDDAAYVLFADFNEDQNIDRYDYGILAEYYGKTAV